MPPAQSPLSELLPPLLDICREAAGEILEYYAAPDAGEYKSKADTSPLTRADVASHRVIQRGLASLTPDWPLLSEESRPEELRDRLHWPRCWMVDPLDGTKEFLARTGEFTINIALIEDHRPVLGVLYQPLAQRGFAGIPGQGALRFDGQGHVGVEIHTRPLQAGRPLVVFASRRHRGQRLTACLEWLQRERNEIDRRDSGSALKFCRLAAGEGDLYPRFSPCSEWDTAAGQALLEAAGGALLDLEGKPLRYNRRQSLLWTEFMAFGDPGHSLWRRLLEWGAGA